MAPATGPNHLVRRVGGTRQGNQDSQVGIVGAGRIADLVKEEGLVCLEVHIPCDDEVAEVLAGNGGGEGVPVHQRGSITPGNGCITSTDVLIT